MSSGTEPTSEQLNLSVDGVSLTVATVRRCSDLVIVFLQGLGSTKEDYPDAAHEPAFAGRPFLAYDARWFSGSRASTQLVSQRRGSAGSAG